MADNQTFLSCSEARKGEMVTTICNMGGVGIGYLVNGVVWQTTGSYWAAPKTETPGGLAEYICDGGATYMAAVKKLTGWG